MKSIVIDDSEIEKIMRCLQKCTSKDKKRTQHIHWDPEEKLLTATNGRRMFMWSVGDQNLEKLLGKEPEEFDWESKSKMLTPSNVELKDYISWNRILPAKGKYLEIPSKVDPFTYVACATGLMLNSEYEDVLKIFKPYGMWFSEYFLNPVLFDLGMDLRYAVFPSSSPEPYISGAADIPEIKAERFNGTYSLVERPSDGDGKATTTTASSKKKLRANKGNKELVVKHRPTNGGTQMTLEMTKAMMTDSDYETRLYAEYWQTKIRYDKLHRMLVKWEAGTLNFTPACPKASLKSVIRLLTEQASYMGNYLRILEVRAEIEGVTLFPEEKEFGQCNSKSREGLKTADEACHCPHGESGNASEGR